VGFIKKVVDPTDPRCEIDAYVRLAFVKYARAHLGVGLYAEFLAYRSREAAEAAGQPLALLKMEIGPEEYDRAWEGLFSPRAQREAGIDLTSAIYLWAQGESGIAAGCESVFEAGQVPAARGA
jgi:hypothetical protein